MSLAAARVRARPLLSGRAGFLALVLVYALLVAACLGTLAREGEHWVATTPGGRAVLRFAPPHPEHGAVESESDAEIAADGDVRDTSEKRAMAD